MTDEPIEHAHPRRAALRPLRLMRRLFFLLLWLGLIAGGLIFWDAAHFLRTPGCANEEPPLAVLETWFNQALKGVPPWDIPAKAPAEPADVIITIEPGATFIRVAWDLRKAGAISNVSRFLLLGKYENALGTVKAGKYMVSTGWTPDRVLKEITSGRAILYRLTLREGLTWWETVKAVEDQGFAKAADFTAVLHDPKFLADHHIPFDDAEGFLFPETYLLPEPKTLDKVQAEKIAAYLVDSFWSRNEAVWSRLPVKQGGNAVERRFSKDGALIRPSRNATAPPTQAGGNGASRNATVADGNGTLPVDGGGSFTVLGPATPEDVDPAALKRLLTLASLVEKETAVPAERPRVAGVYAKRLEKGMLLQCDPTIIYGVGPSFSGSIRRSQLDDEKNLYNTYIHPGLPPGPICSPGPESLKAAVSPEEHDYLYFVANGVNGGHVFSKTLNEHNKAVQEYRRTQGR